VILRPSYVLGGRAMEIVYDEKSLEKYVKIAVDVSPEHPVFIDKYLSDAIEVDVDAVSDGKNTYIGGLLNISNTLESTRETVPARYRRKR